MAQTWKTMEHVTMLKWNKRKQVSLFEYNTSYIQTDLNCSKTCYNGRKQYEVLRFKEQRLDDFC